MALITVVILDGFAPCKGIRENFACGIRNPTNDCNSESKFYCQILESSTSNPESAVWNPESKTVLDSLTWGEWFLAI